MSARSWLWIAIAAIAFFTINAFVSWPDLSKAKARAAKQSCLSRMVSIGLASRMWSIEHDERLPRTFMEASNELSSPKVLICYAAPDAEALRQQWHLWEHFVEARASYEVVNPGVSETNRDNVFFRCKIHGFLGYVDDTIFGGKRHLSTAEAKGGQLPR